MDATIGLSGHSVSLIELINPGGRLIGIDWDKQALEIARQGLFNYRGQIDLFCNNFTNLGGILKSLGIKVVDGILLDLGLSSYQLSDPKRGFSFQTEGPLDMRMDQKNRLKAEEIVNYSRQVNLIRIFQEYGEERWSKRIARAIVERRKSKRIQTTAELVDIIQRTVPQKRASRIHRATRVFQALRIAVNKELDNLNQFLNDAPMHLAPKGRLAVISFHSLEDRLVKEAFRRNKTLGIFRVLTPKPVRPTLEEKQVNPRARSGRLRVAERL